jgi:hypothetical protein
VVDADGRVIGLARMSGILIAMASRRERSDG